MSAAADIALPKLRAWLRTAATAGEMPMFADIAARFACSTKQVGRLLRQLEQSGDIRVDRTKPNRPKFIVVVA